MLLKAFSRLLKTVSEMIIKVIIVKGPPRFDRSSQDILGIKPKLSEFANRVYDQCLLKSNNSENIHLVELDLVQKSIHLKQIVYGNQKDSNYDGVHFLGVGSSRHFTYRVIQSIAKIISKPNQTEKLHSFSRDRVLPGRANHSDKKHTNKKHPE